MKDEDKTKEELIKELKLLREEQEKGVFKDIAKHKQAEETLQQYEVIISSSTDMLALLDKQFNYLAANKAYIEAFKLTFEQLIGNTPAKVFGEEFFNAVIKPNADRCLAGEEVNYQDWFDFPAYGRRYMDITYYPYYSKDNKVMGFVVNDRNITKRKQAEKSLLTERQRLHNVLEVMPMMVCLLTPDYHVTFANRAFREKFGESNGRHCYEYCFGKKEPCDFCESYEVLKTGKPHRWEVTSPDGATIIDVYDFPFTDVDGLPMILEVDVDITERKQAEETLKKANLKLQELDQLKSMFVASMSHELKTPLNAIIGFTDVILNEISGEINEEQRKQLTRVKNNANYLLDLVNNAIDISKIEAGKVKIIIQEFDLSALLREIKDNFTVAAAKKGLELSLEVPPLLLIEGEERRTQQILVNLLSNALKFTARGEIKTKIVKKDQMVEIAVRDTGIGIRRREDMDKLFKPFSRVDGPGKIGEGTGLGLYLSKKNANLLGGDIMVESEFGKGSVFTLTLPLKYKEDKV